MSLPPPAPPRSGYPGTTLAVTGVSGVFLGIMIGVAIATFLAPQPSAPPAPTATASDSAEPEGSAESTASASSNPAPGIDPAALAYQRKLAELRKKVKRSRAKQMDAECDKYFKGKLPAGYVFSGGRFDENALVASSYGCTALARAAKAPWFCCFK
jgi:hypothetical protein